MQVKPIEKNETSIEETKTSYSISAKEIILYIWIAGVILFLTREIYVYKSFYKKLKEHER